MSSPTNKLLTADVDNSAGEPIDRWIIELDVEHGLVQYAGKAAVTFHNGPNVAEFVESSITGGCYDDPFTVGRVVLRSAEEHLLAVFPSEANMVAGARDLLNEMGDPLPYGIHIALGAL